MAAPVPGFIRLPDDSGNTGKKVRTQSRVVGADTVHEHFVIPVSRQLIKGLYHLGGAAVQSVLATAHNGTSTGFFWFENPLASAVNARVRRMEFAFTIATELDHLTVPRIVVQRFTWSSGIGSGTAVGAAKNKTTDDANVANWRTASTNLTGIALVSGAIAYQIMAPVLGLTTSGMFWAAGPIYDYDPIEEDGFIDIAPGEGLVVFQLDNGTASDGRRFSFTARWDEYDRT
jgi:hypothetical protein